MRSSKFTVVIPTCNRASTLRWALKSCTTQDYDDLTILVSDNASDDETRSVVEGAVDRRIRYVNPGKRVSMSANWEFALSHVEHGFVTFLGDDDALLPRALARLGEQMGAAGAELFAAPLALYRWPHTVREGKENSLSLPTGAATEMRASRSELRKLLDGERIYWELPGVYYGCVSMSLIRKAKAQTGDGRFFRSMNPDIFSALRLAAGSESFLFSERPFCLAGHSQYSTGESQLTADPRGRKAAEEFLSTADIPFHRSLSYVPSIAIMTAESYFQLCELIEPPVAPLAYLAKVIPRALDEALGIAHAEAREASVATIRSMAERHGLVVPPVGDARLSPPAAPSPRMVERNGAYLTIDLKDTQIRNAYDAAALVRSVFDLIDGGFPFAAESPRGFLDRYLSPVMASRMRRSGVYPAARWFRNRVG